MNEKHLKLALIEEFYMNRQLQGGRDVKALPLYIKESMLDAIGKILFMEEWTISSGEVKAED